MESPYGSLRSKRLACQCLPSISSAPWVALYGNIKLQNWAILRDKCCLCMEMIIPIWKQRMYEVNHQISGQTRMIADLWTPEGPKIVGHVGWLNHLVFEPLKSWHDAKLCGRIIIVWTSIKLSQNEWLSSSFLFMVWLCPICQYEFSCGVMHLFLSNTMKRHLAPKRNRFPLLSEMLNKMGNKKVGQEAGSRCFFHGTKTWVSVSSAQKKLWAYELW